MDTITLTVPPNSTIFPNEDPRLICRESRWTDIAEFYLANYLAHVATVRTVPGELDPSIAWTLLCCLLFPINGVFRGLKAMWSFSSIYIYWKHRPLDAAVRSGALCMVVRDVDWKPAAAATGGTRVSRVLMGPQNDPKTENSGATDSSNASRDSGFEPHDSTPKPSARKFDLTFYCPQEASGIQGVMLELTRKIHGSYSLPEGYTFATVPVDAEVDYHYIHTRETLDTSDSEQTVSCCKGEKVEHAEDITHSSSLPKAIASIIQLCIAVTSLYRTEGSQIVRYGYAAFGLTVAPYAVMSFINLLSTIMAVEYPKLYMVHSAIMEEAIQRGGSFGAVVGSITTDQTQITESTLDAVVELEINETEQDKPVRRVLLRDTTPSHTACGDHKAQRVGKPTSRLDMGTDDGREQSGKTGEQGRYLPKSGILAIPICLPIKRVKNPVNAIVLGILTSFINFRSALIVDNPEHWCLYNTATKKRKRWTELKTAVTNMVTSALFADIVWHVATISIPAGASLGIVGGLSRWSKGTDSTLAQRTWTMMWLLLGFTLNLPQIWAQYKSEQQACFATPHNLSFTHLAEKAHMTGPERIIKMLKRLEDHGHKISRNNAIGRWIAAQIVNPDPVKPNADEESLRPRGSKQKLERLPNFVGRVLEVGTLLLWAAPAIGGFVVVGQMFNAYGTCFRVF